MKKETTKLMLPSLSLRNNGLKYFAFFVGFCFFLNVSAQEAAIWRKYKGELTGAAAAGIPDLEDYSYAGYKQGAVTIPEATGTIFDVTDYGAIPNDNKTDRPAIKQAVAAAEAAGGGIVFFPPGEFIIHEVKGEIDEAILIQKSNIVIKGSGSMPGGTVINMKNPMTQTAAQKSSGPFGDPAFKFKATFISSLGASNIVEDVNEGENSFVLDNVNFLVRNLAKGHKYIRVILDPSAATKGNNGTNNFLGSLTAQGHWDVVSRGFQALEIHEVDYIDEVNKRVYIKDIFVDDIKASQGWRVETRAYMENCGFEDIHFKAHLGSGWRHNPSSFSGAEWNAVSMSHAAHSWVRRSRFTSVTSAVSSGLSYALSYQQILVDGNRGHNLLGGSGSSRIFFGLIWDNTSNGGQWHGVDFSSRATGLVAWRIETRGRGVDIHANQPRSNLFDLYESIGVTGHGGAVTKQPNHLTGLTFWNHKRVGGGPVSNYNFQGSAIVADPTIVGYHGTSTTFRADKVGYEESNGTKVSPESLYEAQLEHRLGTKPQWIERAIENYEALKIAWYDTSGNSVLSVGDVNEKPSVSLYPNPASKMLYLSGVPGNGTLDIYNISGKKVKTVTLSNIKDGVDISALKAGLYFVKSNLSEANSSVLKFVKQ